MLRIAVVVLLGLATCAAPGAGAPETKKQVFEGVIKEIRGVDGVLVLALKGDAKAKDRTFQVRRARILGPAGTEWKIGDMQEGDRVEVEMARDGRVVQEVRVVAARRKKK